MSEGRGRDVVGLSAAAAAPILKNFDIVAVQVGAPSRSVLDYC